MINETVENALEDVLKRTRKLGIVVEDLSACYTTIPLIKSLEDKEDVLIDDRMIDTCNGNSIDANRHQNSTSLPIEETGDNDLIDTNSNIRKDLSDISSAGIIDDSIMRNYDDKMADEIIEEGLYVRVTVGNKSKIYGRAESCGKVVENLKMIKPVEYYKFVVKSLADPRTQNWFLISEPWQLLTIILLYLYAVYKFLPAYMLNKEPYTLKKIIGAYNIFQIIACGFLIYGVSTSGWLTDYSLGCQVVDYSENEMPLRMAKFMWWHMIVKMCELLETCFFVLRKKTNQVTFLHVYHHISTLILAWIACKYFPGGMISFTVLPNSFIHIIMYGYYFLTALGPTMRKKMDIVKSKLTILQLIQLGIILIHSVQIILPGCEIPNAAGYIYLPNMCVTQITVTLP
ncbi:hypothetical protein RN001_013173 [Aquatica leii]|uniref:Elongation of very long chain fatty acids protein n=1 Tax=Aquatica leii TaxID=1421715 RepID=A0AAN7QCX3_9COLE|nr:hypothetical protein RN001_013173 [Aquatica leii]